MNISPVNNVAFGKIYTVYGPKSKMKRLETILPNNKSVAKAQLGYIDATNVYKNMDTFKSMKDINLNNIAKIGNKVGYLFTDEDIVVRKAIEKMTPYVAEALNLYSEEMIDFNETSIVNFF